MKKKNEWDLVEPLERDVNAYIFTLSPKQHLEQDYNQLLQLKQNYQKQAILPNKSTIETVLHTKLAQSHTFQAQKNGFCSCCYEELFTSKYVCRVCANCVCKKCLVRERQLKNGQLVLFCQKCDNQYLQAMSQVNFFNKSQKLSKVFLKLIGEQEILENMIAGEKKKIFLEGSGSSKQVLQREHEIHLLQEENKLLNILNNQMAKKINFGKTIKRDLNKKLIKIRKILKESFGSISNTDQMMSEVEPPRVDNEVDISVENINESLLTSMLESQHEGGGFDMQPEKCKCKIY